MILRDAALTGVLLLTLGLALYRPWLGTLALAFFSYTRPFAYGAEYAGTLPASALLLGTTLASLAIAAARQRLKIQRPPADFRLLLLLAFWLWCWVTTWAAFLPGPAYAKQLEFTHMLVGLLPTLLLVDSRARLRALLAVMALGIGVLTVKGGYWAVMTGFQDRVYGPPHSHFGGNNEFAVLTIMNLPLLLLLRQESSSAVLRRVIDLGMVLSVCAALSSWSRGALIALAVTLGLMVLMQGRRNFGWVGILAVAVAFVLLVLPQEWFERMQTIVGYQGEGSAEGRLRVWETGLGYARARPLLGTGFEGWIIAAQFGGSGRDWHSAYVEVLAEHGVPGLLLWLAILIGTVVSLAVLSARRSTPPDVAACGRALLIALVAYATGAAFLGIAYWDIWLHLVVLAVLLRRLGGTAEAAAVEAQPAVSAFFTDDAAGARQRAADSR